jgi:hypothetical protein
MKLNEMMFVSHDNTDSKSFSHGNGLYKIPSWYAYEHAL